MIFRIACHGFCIKVFNVQEGGCGKETVEVAPLHGVAMEPEFRKEEHSALTRAQKKDGIKKKSEIKKKREMHKTFSKLISQRKRRKRIECTSEMFCSKAKMEGCKRTCTQTIPE